MNDALYFERHIDRIAAGLSFIAWIGSHFVAGLWHSVGGARRTSCRGARCLRGVRVIVPFIRSVQRGLGVRVVREQDHDLRPAARAVGDGDRSAGRPTSGPSRVT